MTNEDSDITKLWRAPVPDRMANGCYWAFVFIFGGFIFTGASVLVAVKLGIVQ